LAKYFSASFGEEALFTINIRGECLKGAMVIEERVVQVNKKDL